MRAAPFPTRFDDTVFPGTGRAVARGPERLGRTAGFPRERARCGQAHLGTDCRPGAVPPAEREDRARLLAEPVRLPGDVARQARTAGLPDVVHDRSGSGAGAGLPVVRER